MCSQTKKNEISSTKLTKDKKPERKISASVAAYLVTVSEELKILLQPDGLNEPEFIVGLSEILDIDDVLHVKRFMFGEPSWHLAFSTSLHHHSLDTFYKKLSQYQQMNGNENILLTLKDTNKNVFGLMFTSLKPHRNFILNNDEEEDQKANVMLFHCRPFKIFPCCLGGEHKCVMRKYIDTFYIGYKDGTCGLWLNEDLSIGRIQELKLNPTTSSVHNIIEPKVVEYQFQIKTLECWSFGYK